MKTIDKVGMQALREIPQATEMRERAIAMREQALEMRLRLWLQRLASDGRETCHELVVERALDAAISVASADFANIQLVHPTGYRLELKAQRGFGDSFVNYFEQVNDGHTACARALTEQRLIAVEEVALSEIFAQTDGLEVALADGVRAVTSAPLFGGRGQVLGVLSVYYRQPRPTIDSDIVRFRKLAAGVAALLEPSLRT